MKIEFSIKNTINAVLAILGVIPYFIPIDSFSVFHKVIFSIFILLIILLFNLVVIYIKIKKQLQINQVDLQGLKINRDALIELNNKYEKELKMQFDLFEIALKYIDDIINLLETSKLNITKEETLYLNKVLEIIYSKKYYLNKYVERKE